MLRQTNERVTTRSRDLFGTEGTVLVGTCSFDRLDAVVLPYWHALGLPRTAP